MLTRPEALATLRALAGGLDPDLDGVRRLLERVASHDDAEALRSLLAEEGARVVVEAARPAGPIRGAERGEAGVSPWSPL